MIQYTPEALYEHGFTDLVSVIPPGAALLPSSKIVASQVGKIPGRRTPNGMYAGYNWRAAAHTLDDVRQWQLDGANVGLRADRFPALDIDTLDPALADMVEQAATAKLGLAPTRTGRAPKRLLMYRTDEPFGRMRLWIERGDTKHLIEFLGAGNQYLVYGIHPSTHQPYTWDVDPNTIHASHLTKISREQVETFFQYIEELVDLSGIGFVTREGDGRVRERTTGADQTGLRAPSIDVLRDAVRSIPNTDEHFPTRESYVKVGYAIRAACGDELEEGASIFGEWAEQWQGPKGARNNPDVVRSDWRRMKPPFAVGWSWLVELARSHGFNDATLAFDGLEVPPTATEEDEKAIHGSDQWLAEQVAGRQRGRLRYVPAMGKWMVWQAGRWVLDAELLAEDLIKRELRALANDALRVAGAAASERQKAEKFAMTVCAAWKVRQVMDLVRTDRAIAIGIDALDADPWSLNTPDGIIDLRTGTRRAADPDALCTKQTRVPLQAGATPKAWLKFLHEATRGDTALIGYLQRLCGYALTGSTREQHLTFIWGEGGNGKGVFLNVLSGILGDYATASGMETFTASRNERHTTELARLAGARLVTASETEAGKRWDEARVKALTGGDLVTARFMHKDAFEFLPQFKLLFIGNHKPEIRDVGAAMRRRIQLVQFQHKPAVVDQTLGETLRAEWPAILAWMLEGCLEWQRIGLAPPEHVRLATDAYFSDEDALGRFLVEETERGDYVEGVQTLFSAWEHWTRASNEYTGTMKRFSSALAARGFERTHDVKTRRAAFKGVRVKPTAGLETL